MVIVSFLPVTMQQLGGTKIRNFQTFKNFPKVVLLLYCCCPQIVEWSFTESNAFSIGEIHPIKSSPSGELTFIK